MRSPTPRALIATAALGLALAGGLPAATADEGGRTIALQDRCDPVTFNAALQNPHACEPTHDGRVTFAELGAALAADPAEILQERNALGWRFHSSDTSIKAGQDLLVVNTGGEGHTFTRVSKFGGGCIPPLNAAFGLAPDPRCPAILATTLLPGTSMHVSGLSAGRTYLFECMIHPWMRTTVRVR